MDSTITILKNRNGRLKKSYGLNKSQLGNLVLYAFKLFI